MAEIRTSWQIFFLLSLIILFEDCTGAGSVQYSKNQISHEDIRDAILSLLKSFRDNADKLERHEARERQLGEQLQKSFSQVEKKQKTEESSVLTILESLNTINHRLEVLENATYQAAQCKENKPNGPTIFEQNLMQKMNSLEEFLKNNTEEQRNIREHFDQKLDSITQNNEKRLTAIKTVEARVAEIRIAQNKLDNIGDSISSLDNKVTQILPSLEKLDKILEFQKTSAQITAEVMDKTRTIDNSLTTDADLSTKSTIQIVTNLKEAIEKDVSLLKEKIEHAEVTLFHKQEAIHNDILLSTNANEDLRGDIAKSYAQLLTEIKRFSKMDQVLIQTADNVLDAKRRVEYGTHQILLEVGELIKSTSKEANDTISQRFDIISNEIVLNQNSALKNLSTKIESEISQVWRQIGIMYQTLTNSAEALEKLQQQTEVYINGSLGTMANMDGKVGQITSRMSEVDENLNYLLGRLSLVTQEFNQIKTGLGEALDNFKTSFQTVESKVKDADIGPGPKPIKEEGSTVNSLLENTKYSLND